MVLFIDTSDESETKLALIDKEVLKHKFRSTNLSENLILEIKKFLSRNKKNLNSIIKLAVVTGPGQFSKIRTGVATANALAFGLKIPILGLAKKEVPEDLRKILLLNFQKITTPLYDREPNITTPHK